MAANIFQNGGVNNNWNTVGNWSLGRLPTATDGDVATFNATSPNCIVNISAVCNNIDFTGYTNTITMTNGITISGNVTLSSTMLISGSGGLTFNASGTWISNDRTWPNSITVASASTVTISSFTFSIGGTLTLQASATFSGVNGFSTSNFTCITAGITHSFNAGTSYIISGTMTTTGTDASHITLQSSSLGSYSILTLNGNQDNGFLDGTWIDSSGGQTIWSYSGVLTNTINWLDLSNFPIPVSYVTL